MRMVINAHASDFHSREHNSDKNTTVRYSKPHAGQVFTTEIHLSSCYQFSFDHHIQSMYTVGNLHLCKFDINHAFNILLKSFPSKPVLYRILHPP